MGTTIFFAGKAPAGWCLSIAASAGSLFIEDDAAFMFDAQILTGYKWAWENNVTFGVGVGISYLYFNFEDEFTFGGAMPSVGFEFGYVW